ncbi:unnamed protein product [Ixodes persulcatus]
MAKKATLNSQRKSQKHQFPRSVSASSSVYILSGANSTVICMGWCPALAAGGDTVGVPTRDPAYHIRDQ